jgi:hypothetical protein
VNTNTYFWATEFKGVYQRALERYRSGKSSPALIVEAKDAAFLASIGCSRQELFDFIDDFARAGEPEFEDVLLVTAVRRDYFVQVQEGKPSNVQIDMRQLPSKQEQLGGIPWLPRIVEKAKAKLRGEMPPELMYLCGGDRPFLQSHRIHPADFLRAVWQYDADHQKVLEWFKKQSCRQSNAQVTTR